MRPTSNATTAAVDVRFAHWNSPIPYLFGGLALTLGLISIALVILACSYRKSSSNSASDGTDEEKPAKQVNMEAELEPKTVVIMPGDNNPTYLAKPVSSIHHGQQV